MFADDAQLAQRLPIRRCGACTGGGQGNPHPPCPGRRHLVGVGGHHRSDPLLDGRRAHPREPGARPKLSTLSNAIAGGPYIGLLGTVLGIMVVFLGTAMAGDVNINAIAPGMAAALLATAMGLFVAIPALFGYNRLITRNKEVSADMRVFVDEFITRLAEMHGEGQSSEAAHQRGHHANPVPA
jgi:biopolymer transport protein ExbB